MVAVEPWPTTVGQGKLRAPSLSGRFYVPLVVAATLLAAALRMYKLADANPWWDEGFTAWLASMDVPGMLLRTAGDTHPPLSYLLYHGWLGLAGRGLYALRYQAALFGIATVPACAYAARRVGGQAAGVGAALLMAVARFDVWWSEQIRMYALVGLLAALSIGLLLAGVGNWEVGIGKGRRGVGRVVAVGVVNLVGLYTLYFFAVLVLLESLLVLWLGLRGRGRLLWTWVVVHLGVVAAMAPWLWYFRQHAIRFAGLGQPVLGFAQFAAASWSELALGIDTNVQAYLAWLIGLGLLALALLGLGLARRGGRMPSPCPRPPRRARVIWLLVVAAGLPLAAYGITLQQGLFYSPTYQTRYDLPALPALVIVLAVGAAALKGWLKLAPLAALLAVAAFTLPPLYADRHRTDDYQSLARLVQAYERPGDVIVFDPDWNFHLFLLDYGGHLPWQAFPLNQPVDAAYAAQQFQGWLAKYQAVWLLQEAGGHDAGATHPVGDWLNGHLRRAMQLQSGDRLLTLYQPASAPPRALDAGFQPAHQAGGIAFDQPLDDVRVGDVLDLAVYGSQPPKAVTLAGQTFAATMRPGAAGFAIPIGPAIPAGRQPIAAVLADGRAQAFSSVYVEPHASSTPAAPAAPLAHPLGASFGGLAELTSYDISRTNGAIDVRLQWQDEAPFSQDYTVFVHVLDAAGKVIAQRDSQPVDGQRPTIQWQPGQVIDDAYSLPLPPAGRQLEIGLYLQATGQRLQLADGDDRVLIPLNAP